MILPSENELLTVEQFAQRFQVSRTTVFGWLKNGNLQEGIHYFRLGRILRFRWPFFMTDQRSTEECKSLEIDRDLQSARQDHGR